MAMLRQGSVRSLMALRTARPAAFAHKRWVETVSGIDTPAPNVVLPWEQRLLPTTKTFYGEETIHNTYTSGSPEVRGGPGVLALARMDMLVVGPRRARSGARSRAPLPFLSAMCRLAGAHSEAFSPSSDTAL